MLGDECRTEQVVSDEVEDNSSTATFDQTATFDPADDLVSYSDEIEKEGGSLSGTEPIDT